MAGIGRRGLAARAAADRLAGARRPQLRPHGGADHRARRRGRDGRRPQPAVGDRGRRGRARADGRSPTASRCSSAARCSRRRWSCSPSSTTPRRPRGSSSPTSASSPPRPSSDTLDESVRRGRVYAGYSGWGAGQLEAELAEEAWIVEPPLPAELFPDEPENALARRPRPQGRPVRAARADARRPIAELSVGDGRERVCVIGAGSSGIAALPGAARARDRVRLLRGRLGGGRQLALS